MNNWIHSNDFFICCLFNYYISSLINIFLSLWLLDNNDFWFRHCWFEYLNFLWGNLFNKSGSFNFFRGFRASKFNFKDIDFSVFLFLHILDGCFRYLKRWNNFFLNILNFCWLEWFLRDNCCDGLDLLDWNHLDSSLSASEVEINNADICLITYEDSYTYILFSIRHYDFVFNPELNLSICEWVNCIIS